MANTPMQELLNLIPSGQEIKQAISDNDMDEKMLDEWLWERIYKDKDWVGLDRLQIVDAFNEGHWNAEDWHEPHDGGTYYNNKFANQ